MIETLSGIGTDGLANLKHHGLAEKLDRSFLVCVVTCSILLGAVERSGSELSFPNTDTVSSVLRSSTSPFRTYE